MDQVGEAMQAEYNETLEELRQERQEMATRMEQLENATEEEWREMKNDMATYLAGVGTHLRHAALEIERAFDPEGDLD